MYKYKKIVWLLIGVSGCILAGTAIWLASPKGQTPQSPSHRAVPAPVARDSTPPQVSLQNIVNNQKVSGNLTLAAEAADNQTVQKVEFYVDGVFVGVSYTRPFTLLLDTTSLNNGTHVIIAKAYDAANNDARSQITIVVDNTTASTDAVTIRSSAQSSAASAKSSTNRTNSNNAPSSHSDVQSPTPPGTLILSATDGYTANLTWGPSTDNTGVRGYKVFRDGVQIGTTAATSYQDQTVVPGNGYAYYIVAYDAADNTSDGSNQPVITLVSTTVWLNAESPQQFDNAPGALELGVKFRPLTNGKITGVRFYKAAGSTGTHTGSLWSSTGTQLATATFTSETGSGWQDVAFATPISVTAGTTYVASYFAPNGGYGYTSAYFASAGITSQYLTAMQSGVDGNNGVFHNGSAGFPSSSFDNTNYWVDVDFTPNANADGPTPKLVDNAKTYAGYPGTDNTGVPAGKRLPKRNRNVDIFQDGVTLKDTEVDADVNIKANNVTVQNLRITSPVSLIWGMTQVTGKSGLTVEDTEIFGDGTHQIQYGILDSGTTFTGRRLNIYHMTQGVQSNVNVTLEDSYIHDQIFFAGDHNGGYLSTGGNNIHIAHNTLQNPLNQTAVLAFFCDFAPVTNVLAENNLLVGAGYSFYAPSCAGSGNIKVRNNKFSREIWPNGGFNGPVALWNPARPGDEWLNNTWLEDGTTLVP